MPPRRLLGPLLAVSGVAVAATPFAVRAAGAIDKGVLLMLVSTFAIMVPGTTLAAVTPMVTKLRLTSLNETGTVVGDSAIGTTGAIVGTVVTGFILISRLPVSGIMVGLGAVLVGAAAVVELRVRGWRSAVAPAVLVILGGGAAVVARGGCDVETTYHCAVVVTDSDRASGRVLMLDGAPHSYVDIDDPTYLQWDYAKAVASVIDTAYPEGLPLRVYHIGGGGLTLPRYLEHVRPGTSSLVSEIDPGVVKIDTEQLELKTGQGIEVEVEDARLGISRLADDSRDLVLGDAFGGVSVPWHLTTREMVREIDRVLTEEGVCDQPPRLRSSRIRTPRSRRWRRHLIMWRSRPRPIPSIRGEGRRQPGRDRLQPTLRRRLDRHPHLGAESGLGGDHRCRARCCMETPVLMTTPCRPLLSPYVGR